MPSPTAVYWRTAPLIALACAILFIAISVFALAGEVIVTGLLWGTGFQHVVLAACWAVLGPGPLRWRLPLSLVWVGLIAASIVSGVAMWFASVGLLWVFALLAGLWLAVQVPLWGVALLFGLRLWHQGTPQPDGLQRQRQFGIAQLMIYTAVVGALLGVARWLLPAIWKDGPPQGEMAIISLVFVTQLLTSLPVIFAMFVPRHALPAVLISLVLLALGVSLELVVAGNLDNFRSPGDRPIVIAINVVGATWAIVFAAVVRGSGYHFGVPDGTPLAP